MFGGVLVCVFFGSVVALALRYPAENMHQPLAFGFVVIAAGGSLLAALWMIASPWPPGRLKYRAFVFVSMVYAGILLSSVAQKLAGTPPTGTEVMQLAITALSFQGAVLILVGRLVHEHGLGWSQAFGFARRWPRAALVGFMSAFSVLPAAWMLQVGSTRLMTWLDWNPQIQQAVSIFSLTSTLSDRVLLGLVALLLAPIAEELLFRGIMYPALKGFGLPRFAFWSTAIVFALIHFNVATFVPLLFFACVLNWLYEWTGNLLACMVAHTTFNAINLVLLLVVKPMLE
jgi:membrane protease YdiL (CAAX protease family)